MKKINTLLMCLAAAAMTFTACSDADEFEPNNNNGKGITIIAENPEVTNDTRTSITNDGNNIAPVWKENDMIAVLTYEGQYKYFSYFKNKSADLQKTASFVFNHGDPFEPKGKSLLAMYKDGSTSTFTFDQSKNEVTIDFVSKVKINAFIPGQRMDNDFLISKKISDAESAVKDGKLVLQFKRLSSVVRLKVKDNVGKFKDSEINKILIETENSVLADEFIYNIETGEMRNSGTKPAKSIVLNMENVDLYPDNTSMIYLCMMPTTLIKDDNLMFTIETAAGDRFTKRIKITEGDIKLESGKITTFNLTINEDDVSKDHTLMPEVSPGNIITKAPGYISYKIINEALPDGVSTLKISGDINMLDIKNSASAISIKSLLKLDLSDANIKAIGSIYKENCMYSSRPLNNVTEFIFPNSLEEIQQNALEGSNTTVVKIGRNIKTLAAECITMSTEKPSTIYLDAPYSETLDNNIADNFVTVYEGSTLCINESWKSHISGNTWKGITWKNITFCNDNGQEVK